MMIRQRFARRRVDGWAYIHIFDHRKKKQVDDTRMPLHRSGLEDSSISLRQKIALPPKTWRSDYYKLPAWKPPGYQCPRLKH